MKLNRRNLLKMLPTAPALVRQAQETAKQMVGASVTTPVYDMGIYPDGSDGKVHGGAMVRLLRLLGLPQWKHDQMRRDVRSQRWLDPDVASLQSISLSGKLQIQWRRNLADEYRRLYERPIEQEARNAFLKKHNLDWF